MILMATMLASCGKCFSPSTVEVLGIDMSAPSQYPAGEDLNVPVLITNTGNTTLFNMVYSAPAETNTTGSILTITPASQAQCATLTSGQTCQLTVHVTPSSTTTKQRVNQIAVANVANNAGTFKVLAKNDKINTEQSVYIGLVDVPATTGVGIDGVTFLYDNKVMSGSSCQVNSYQNVLITMVVTSENAGNFNTLSILDSNGNELPYEVLSGNSGQGMTNLAVGSVVTLAAKVPCGAIQFVFKPVLKLDNNIIDNGVGENPYGIDIIPSTSKEAILNVLPSMVNLNESKHTQIVTIINSGNATATNLNISVGNSYVTISNNACGSSLAAGALCSYMLSFDDNLPIVGTTSSNVAYNDSQADQNASIVVNYRGKTPFVGVTLSSNNMDYSFNATTESSVFSSVVTITNAGRVLPLTLSDWPSLSPYFTISTNAGTLNDCSNDQFLEPGALCNILVIYNNSTVSSGILNMPIAFTYSDIDHNVKSGKSDVNLNYNTIQAAASLRYDSLAYNFDSILNNDGASAQQVITVSNIGQAAATNVNIDIPAAPYSIFSNTCGATIASGATCQVIVQFGPASSSVSVGTKNAILFTSYLPYLAATSPASASAKLAGNVYATKTAVINTSITANSGFVAGGTGSFSAPFQVQQNNGSPTITYVITNAGEVPANQFYLTSNPSALLPWSISSSSCGTQQAPIPLAAGGNCVVTFTLNSGTIGSNNLDLSNIQMNWVDEDSPSGQTQNATEMVYANVFLAPSIVTTTSPSPIGNLRQESQLIVTATLRGGYNVGNQTIVANITNDANNDLTASSAECQLSSTNSSCSVTFNVISTPVNENDVEVTLSNSTTPVMAPTPANYLFNIVYGSNALVTPSTVVNAVSPQNATSFVFYLTNSPGNLNESITIYSNDSYIASHISYAYSASCSDLTETTPCTVTITADSSVLPGTYDLQISSSSPDVTLSTNTLQLLVQTYVYINSYGGNGTYRCLINVNSQQSNFISNCTSSTLYGTKPEGIYLQKGLTSESSQIFIAQGVVNGNPKSNAISKCLIDRPTGALICNNSPAFAVTTNSAANGLVVTSDDILYLGIDQAGIWKSTIDDPISNIYNWTTNYFTTNKTIYQLAQNPYRTTDYIAAAYSAITAGPLYYCKSSGCSPITVTNNPNIWLAATFADPVNNPNIVYVSSYNNGIYRCSITGSGFVSGSGAAMTCDTTPTVPKPARPAYNLTVYGSYLYFDSGSGGNGSTTKCQINTNGTVKASSCIASSMLIPGSVGLVVF